MDITASEYIIKEIGGTQYMFMQWKEGGYMIKGLQPSYYVLRKYDPSKPRPVFNTIKVIEDKIDYPFVNDEKLLGKWKTVDFVYEIENFDPERIIRHKDLFVKGVTILDGGSVAESFYGELQGSEEAV
jgi:bla regulator protein BlaR1